MANKRKTGDAALAARLRTARADAKLTTKQVAEASGVSASAVTQWETALTYPSPGNLQALSGALGVSEAWLRFGEGNPSRPTTRGSTVQKKRPIAEDIRRVERQLSEALAAVQTLAARIERGEQ